MSVLIRRPPERSPAVDPGGPESSGRGRSARLIVLALLMTNLLTALLLSAGQIDWSTGLVPYGAAAALGLYAVSFTVALHAAVTPWISPAHRLRAALALAAVTAVTAGPLVLAAEPGATPWAWLAGFAVGALILLDPSPRGVALALAAASAGGLWSVGGGADLRDTVVFVLVVATAVAAMGAVTLWLLAALLETEAARQAHTMLAVTQERLRIARDLHDALAQNLTVICMKAELAEGLASTRTEDGRRLAGQIRELAHSGLQQTRDTLRGIDPLDLNGQVRTATQVLESAGIVTTVEMTSSPLPADVAYFFAAVLREATTNVLRHSTASMCAIAVTRCDGGARLTVVNDRPKPHSGDPGTGLRGLTERGRTLGATLEATVSADSFTLRVDAAWARS